LLIPYFLNIYFGYMQEISQWRV